MVVLEVSFVVAVVTWSIVAGSLLAIGFFLRRPLLYRPILPYRPRQRVPWGLGGAFIAVMLTVLALASAFTRGATAPTSPAAMEEAVDEPDVSSDDFATRLFLFAGAYLGVTALVVVIVVVYYRAGSEDFGLPPSARELLRDIGLGTGVGLAGIVPVYAIQIVAIGVLGIDASHPILDRLQSDLHPMVVAAGVLAAMVVAPVFEEIVYRALLQGALERWEDRAISWPFSLRKRPTPPDVWPEQIAGGSAAEAQVLIETPAGNEAIPDLPPLGNPPLDAAGMAPGLRHGWFPIFGSSLLFSLAHIGQGPSPIPLFLLALMLGYVYQRTHRIVPCMVAHLVFNAVSMGMLFLMVTSQAKAS